MNKAIKLCFATIFAALAAPAFPQLPKLDYGSLNKQAAKEYLKPIHPGYEGRNPYWNAYATRFLYAPAFDFKENAKAKEYVYTVKADGKRYTFNAAKPNLSLAPIWNDIPAGNVELTVKGVDASGRSVGQVGSRTFFRDYPFVGPYNIPSLPYKEAAIQALRYIHNIPQIKKWTTQKEPDMSLELNQYPSKTVSGTIRCELLLAKYSPADSASALEIAKNAGEFLLGICWPADSALAGFPPTYYGGHSGSFEGNVVLRNQGKTMSMEACKAALAFLDLYDATGDSRYFNQVKTILATYAKLQGADGSIPIKLDIHTGKGVNDVCARLHPLLYVVKRMHDQYGLDDYEGMRKAAEHWMDNYAFEKFEMVGQFEDTPVEGLKPYENLSHWTGVPYAAYVLESGKATKEQIATVRDVINFGEDQFTIWQLGKGSLGEGDWHVPAVEEQYFYRMPVDDSAASMATAWLDLWKVTGDKLALAKGIALINSITNVQKASGMIATAWDNNGGKESLTNFWISCCLGSVQALLLYAECAGDGYNYDSEIASLMKEASPDKYVYGNLVGCYSDSTAISSLRKAYTDVALRYADASAQEKDKMKDNLRAAKTAADGSIVEIKDGECFYIISAYNDFVSKGEQRAWCVQGDGSLGFRRLAEHDNFKWRFEKVGERDGKPLYSLYNIGSGMYIDKTQDGKSLSVVKCSRSQNTAQTLQRAGNSMNWKISNVADNIAYNPKLSNNTIVIYDDGSSASLWQIERASNQGPLTNIDHMLSPAPQTVNVWAIDGTMVRHNVNTSEAIAGLPKGIYVVNEKKTLVR